MNLIKLGLLGKNIQHSRSKSIYEGLLNKSIDYHLFDYENPIHIPELNILFKNLNGLSITAPYKTHFLNKLILSKESNITQAVNCIKKDHDGTFFGYNTDFMACDFILSKYIPFLENNTILVLGNGPMARVIIYLLNKNKFNFIHHFRLDGEDLNKKSFKKYYEQIAVINCCSRGFLFKPELEFQNINFFWDLNYAQDSLYSYLDNNIYFNGLELLELQAKFALDIWNIK